MSETINLMVEGGKASAGPPLGPAIGPTGIPIGDIVNSINEKTKDLKGMKVPVDVIIDKKEKTFKIKIGTPPVSELLKNELNVKKGAKTPGTEIIGSLLLQQIIKVANMKKDSLAGVTNKSRVKSVLGSCIPLGITVNDMPIKQITKLVEDGKYDNIIESNITEISEEELKQLEEKKQKEKELFEKNKEKYLIKARTIMGQMKGKTNLNIRKKMEQEKIDQRIIDELLPN
jgi:large subunit ribosomal protein L11